MYTDPLVVDILDTLLQHAAKTDQKDLYVALLYTRQIAVDGQCPDREVSPEDLENDPSSGTVLPFPET